MNEEITKSLGEVTSEKIIKLILNNNLKIGDKLGVGRSTIREAIKATSIKKYTRNKKRFGNIYKMWCSR